ncbi:hypothetical protein BC628DRAFT_1318080 [Trametes gibbosa]|nr:hypothetical protein BC628DRAFT_1318080 [Trametes gibbosa]
MASTVSQFLCPDVIPKIFEHLLPGPEPGPDEFPLVKLDRQIRQRTLAFCARVCSEFTAPALDILWKCLDDVFPLLSILPSYVPHEKKFFGAITDDEWQRFQAYALRVRDIDLTFVERLSPAGLFDEIWLVLLQRSQGAAILPRLERLMMGDSLGGSMVMLGRTVSSLHLVIPRRSGGEFRAPDTLLDMVRPHLSHVTSLTIQETVVHQNHHFQTASLITTSIDFCSLTHLRTLSIVHKVYATPYVVQSLMDFPSLHRLSLTFEFLAEERATVAATKFAPGFFELQHLELTATYEDVAHFLEASEPAGIKTMAITREYSDVGFGNFTPFLDLEGSQEAYALIPRHVTRLALRFTSPLFSSNRSQAATLFASAPILPATLRTLPDLRELTVSFDGVYSFISDADLEELSETWSALERFEYNNTTSFYREELGAGPPAYNYAELPTFATLLAFAHAHPRLVQLSLPALSPENIPDIRPRVDSSHGLRHLRIQECIPGTNVIALALALECAFRHLELGDAQLAGSVRARGHGVELDKLTLILLALRTARDLGGFMA